MSEQEALERARDAYSTLQVQHGLPPLSEGESSVFEAGWEAAIEYCNSQARAPRKSKRKPVAEDLAASDVSAQLAQRDNIIYGPHDSLPQCGEHVARLGRRGS